MTFYLRALLRGAFNIELLRLLILHRVLWNGSPMKSDKGVTFIVAQIQSSCKVEKIQRWSKFWKVLILACFWINFTFHFNCIFRSFIRTSISTKAENNTFLLFHSVSSVWWKNSTSKQNYISLSKNDKLFIISILLLTWVCVWL